MKCTVLMENTANPGLLFEHGLSVHIEYHGQSILLDAGSSGQFADNAAELGIDLSAVAWGALSHGHYDHADGLRRFFQINDNAPVYLQKTAGDAYFSTSSGSPRFIGIHRDIWNGQQARFRFADGVFQPMEGVWLLSTVTTDAQFASQEVNLLRKIGDDRFVQDDFCHEQSLVFETKKGLVIFNSCCHTGVVNVVKSVMAQLPDKAVHAVVGGLHMMGFGTNPLNCTPEYIELVSQALIELGVAKIYTGHCTGDAALLILKQALGDRLVPLTGGLTMEFE